MLNFDAARQPVRPHELEALVAAVQSAHPSDEQDWLEWKSSLDLTSRAHLASVARCILALANRAPETAATVVEGYGYMIIGVEPGQLLGVVERDNADLDRDLQRVLGQDGPRWRPLWVRMNGKSVLIVEVSPPRPGDPIFVAQRESSDLTAGTIYVRHRARSQPATPDDIRMLSERLRSGNRTLDLRVGVQGEILLRAVRTSHDAMGRHIDAEETRLLSGLASSGSASSVKVGGAIYGLREWVDEPRSEADFRKEVAKYLIALKSGLARALECVSAQKLQPIQLALTNPTDFNFQDVRLELHIEGEVRVVEPVRSTKSAISLLPSPPRKWGPMRNPLYSTSATYVPGTPVTPTIPLPKSQSLQIRHGGSAYLTFPACHMRPRATEDLSPFVCLVQEGAETEVRMTWTTTATNVEGVVDGSLVLAVDGEPFDPWKALVKEATGKR